MAWSLRPAACIVQLIRTGEQASMNKSSWWRLSIVLAIALLGGLALSRSHRFEVRPATDQTSHHFQERIRHL